MSLLTGTNLYNNQKAFSALRGPAVCQGRRDPGSRRVAAPSPVAFHRRLQLYRERSTLWELGCEICKDVFPGYFREGLCE